MASDRPGIDVEEFNRVASRFWDVWEQTPEYQEARARFEQDFINVMLWGCSHPEALIGFDEVAEIPHAAWVRVDMAPLVGVQVPAYVERVVAGVARPSTGRNRHERRRAGRPERRP